MKILSLKNKLANYPKKRSSFAPDIIILKNE